MSALWSALCQHYVSTMPALPSPSFLPSFLQNHATLSVAIIIHDCLQTTIVYLFSHTEHSGPTRSHGGCARPYLYGECRGKSRGISSTACGSVIGKVVSRCGSCVAARNAGLSCKCGMSTLTPDDASIEPAPEPAPAMIKLSLPPSACDSADNTNANNANNNVRVTP